MRILFSIVSRIFFSLIAGFFFAVYFMQHDIHFKKAAEQGLKDIFSFLFDCHVEGTVQSLGILSVSPYITTTNIRVIPKKGDGWEWTCECFTLSLSWFEILFGPKIGIKSDIHSLKAISSIHDNRLCIMDHVEKIINTQKDLPFELRKLQLHKGELFIKDDSTSFSVSCMFDCDVGNFNNRLQTIFYMTKGSVTQSDRILVSDATFRISSDTSASVTTLFTGKMNLTCIDECMPCYMQGSFKQQQGTIRFHNKNGTFVLDKCIFKKTDKGSIFGLEAHIPLAYLQNLLNFNFCATGDCHVVLQGTLYNSACLTTEVCIKDVVIRDCYLGDIKANFSYQHGIMHGLFTTAWQHFGNPSGNITWSLEKKGGTFQIRNTADIAQLPLRYWHIASGDISIQGTYKGLTEFSGKYTCRLGHTKLETMHTLQGALEIGSDNICLKGVADRVNYHIQTGGIENFYIKNITIDNEGKSIVNLHNVDKSFFNGTITCDSLKSLAKKFFGYDLQGQGAFTLQGKLSQSSFVLNLAMKNGNIRLGNTYNFIQSFYNLLELNRQEKEITLKNCSLGLHRGRLLIPYARCLYNEHKSIEYCYIPIHLQHIFLNNKRDMFMVVSGRLVITQELGKNPIIRGTLLIDQGQIRQNIFSIKEQKGIAQSLSELLGFSGDVEFDIMLENKHPIHVRTGFLESEIKLELSLKGSLQHPHVLGKISISDGILRFPYRPLYLTSGVVYIMPHTSDDPVIELHAKGRVKRYAISMYVYGTLLDPHIAFAATPPLSQEQIITLLLGGSETGSLAFVMPSLIMQNVKSLIFGGEQGIPSSFEKYILSPLRYIRIVPSFNDQTGRGGFRGAIEIDVSDQLRAVIQKNFSLSEDTRFEAEYQISDEISLRGLKDERGDIGGEIEARFSF